MNFRINCRPLFTIIFKFKNDNGKTRDFSPLIERVLAGVMLSTLMSQLKLVYEPFGQSNMHSTLDFCPTPARKESNVPLDKRS